MSIPVIFCSIHGKRGNNVIFCIRNGYFSYCIFQNQKFKYIAYNIRIDTFNTFISLTCSVS